MWERELRVQRRKFVVRRPILKRRRFYENLAYVSVEAELAAR